MSQMPAKCFGCSEQVYLSLADINFCAAAAFTVLDAEAGSISRLGIAIRSRFRWTAAGAEEPNVPVLGCNGPRDEQRSDVVPECQRR